MAPVSWPGHQTGSQVTSALPPCLGLLGLKFLLFQVVGAFHFSGDFLSYIHHFIKHGFDGFQLFGVKGNLHRNLLECRKSSRSCLVVSSINLDCSYSSVAKVLLLRQSTNIPSIYDVAEGNVPRGEGDSPKRICCVI